MDSRQQVHSHDLMNGPRRSSPVAECLLAAGLFGASTPLAKLVLADIGPITVAGLLYLGAALATSVPAWRHGIPPRPVTQRGLRLLAGAIVAGGMLGPVFMLQGLRLASAGSVSLWLNLETVATTVLAVLLFREHAHTRTWLAVLAICCAGALLALPFRLELGAAALLIALACLCWGLDNNLTALIDEFTPAQVTFAKGLLAGSINLGVGMAWEDSHFTWEVTGAAAVVGVLGYGLSLVLYVSGAQKLGAARSQLIFSTAPFWGLCLSWVMLAEPIQWVQIAAAGVMACALWLLHTERHTHAHVHAAQFHRHLHGHDDGHHDHPHAEPPRSGWHSHLHEHEPVDHSHAHWPDLHHRHSHDG